MAVQPKVALLPLMGWGGNCGPDGMFFGDYPPLVIPNQTNLEGAMLFIRSRLGEEPLSDNPED